MGQRRCCVSECKSASQLPECADIKFHAFPTNDVARNMWLKNCHIQQTRSITKSNVVCSKHFLESDYQAPKNGRKLLNTNAVPTIFAWGTEKSFQEQLAEAQESSPTIDTSSKDGADKSAKTPSETTPVVKSKKMIRRSQANSAAAAEKQRSASAEEQTTSDANPKMNKARKSLDSATTPEKSGGKEIIKSPTKKFDVAMNLATGAKVEVQDLGGSWHNASVVEVDQGEQEVFISFEKNAKAKGPTAFKLNDEWIPMDSSRLRIPVDKSPIQFKAGDRCLARWTDSRKFPATVVKPLENNKYEVLFDDGLVKYVKGVHMSRIKQPGNAKTPQSTSESPVPQLVPIPLVQATIKKPFKINPIPKFDLSKFNLPDIPEGEWCCPWINDTPIGEEGFLLNADGTKRPTVLVEDQRLPSGWAKHLYQRSSTSGKWDVVLVGPNNKRFRSKSDVKVFLEEIGQSYNPDIYDFSIHKRRAKDIGVYVFTDDYVPPVIPKPTSDFKLDSSLDTSLQDFKQEPFTGFAPNESTSSILSKITQEIKGETSTPIKTEPNTSAIGSLGEESIFVGALRVQIIDNLFQCPKEGCNKSLRKENHLQIHVKHYHPELSEQLGACPNMTDLAYIRTMGTTIEEPSPKNQIPNSQFFEKTFQSEMRTVRKSMSPTRVKIEPKNEDQSTPMPSFPELQANDLKRKPSTSQISPEVREKRKPSATDKVNPPDSTGIPKETVILDGVTATPLAPTSLKKTEVADSKPPTQKSLIPRFKIGNTLKIKGSKVSRRKGRTFKKKFKNVNREFKRKSFDVGANRVPILREDIQRINSNFGSISSRPNRLKFLQYSSTDSNSENSVIDPNFQQRTGSDYIKENGEVIKIVRMRQEEIINCLCSYGEEDGLMIQCELCLCWQHGGCNGIEKESEVPEKYVCYICRNSERARESMKYIHDQEWLYEGKLFVANYHQPGRQYAMRSDILKQSHTLTGNLLELKRSLHSLNVKINIANNKDHPKMYLWSKKWEQSPPRSTEISMGTTAKIEPKAIIEQIEHTSLQTKTDAIAHSDQEGTQKSAENVDIIQNDGETNDQTAADGGELMKNKNESAQTAVDTLNQTTETKEPISAQQPAKPSGSPKKVVKPIPNIPEPEAAIDSLECQHRLLEHIQKEQNTILSRMQTIDAQILALESMDEHPNTNSKGEFARTSQTIRMLLNDLAKMQKLAAMNEQQSLLYSAIDSNQFN